MRNFLNLFFVYIIAVSGFIFMPKQVFAQLVAQISEKQESIEQTTDKLPSQVIHPETITVIPNQGLLLDKESIFIPDAGYSDKFDLCDICRCCRKSNISYENFLETLPNRGVEKLIQPWEGTQEIIQINMNN